MAAVLLADGTVMNDWFKQFDAPIIQTLLTAGLGSALGTLWRMMNRPETMAVQFILKTFVSLTVGIVVGGALIQWFKPSNGGNLTAGSIYVFGR